MLLSFSPKICYIEPYFNTFKDDDSMPEKKKVIKLGRARAVCLPISWVRQVETEMGQKLTMVALDVGATITIYPCFEKKTVSTNATGGAGSCLVSAASPKQEGESKQ